MGRVTQRPNLLEPVEQMAEAALALVCGDSAVLTGRIVTSAAILTELDVAVRTLDGASLLVGAGIQGSDRLATLVKEERMGRVGSGNGDADA